MSRGTVHPEDRGLAAVRRIREVRERDSRIGLQAARAEESAALARHDALAGQLDQSIMPATASPAQLVARAALLTNLGCHLTRSAADVATARAVALDAQAHWSADRTRLGAVDHLLQQRAERRRREVERSAAKEADDIAAQRWLRTHRTPDGEPG